MALTATASKATRKLIQDSLCMSNCSVILKPPNKLNIKFTVQKKPDDLGQLVMTMVNDVLLNGSNAKKCIIFCPTYTECTDVFFTLVDKLGHHQCLHTGADSKPICNLFTAATDPEVKEEIIQEFTKTDGFLQVVVATIAFGRCTQY